MRVRTIVTEDFTNYKKSSMFIGCIDCDGKCCTDGGFSPSVCINNVWHTTKISTVDDRTIIKKYLSNAITHAIVFGLLEPFLQYEEIKNFIYILRSEFSCDDDVVIYTGYRKDEVADKISELSKYKNIIIKYGRFTPNQKSHFDEVLGVYLASDDQYAERIS